LVSGCIRSSVPHRLTLLAATRSKDRGLKRQRRDGWLITTAPLRAAIVSRVMEISSWRSPTSQPGMHPAGDISDLAQRICTKSTRAILRGQSERLLKWCGQDAIGTGLAALMLEMPQLLNVARACSTLGNTQRSFKYHTRESPHLSRIDRYSPPAFLGSGIELCAFFFRKDSFPSLLLPTAFGIFAIALGALQLPGMQHFHPASLAARSFAACLIQVRID